MSNESSDRSATLNAVDPAELAHDLPLLALPDVVMFPGTGVQLELKDSVLAESLGTKPDALVAVFTPKTDAQGELAAGDLYSVGALARVVAVRRIAGTYVLVLRGVARAEIEAITERTPLPRVQVRQLPEVNAADDELTALFLSLQQNVAKVMALLRVPSEFAAQVGAIEAPGALADLVASRIEATTAEKAELLAMLDVKARVLAVLTRVVHRGEVLAMRDTINQQVQSEIGKTQREHMLRQQKRAIEKELGEDDDSEEGELDALEERVAQAKLSEEARDVAQKQLRRLKAMQPGSPDFSATRNYVEWIVDLPWTEASADATDLARVRAVLESDHYGLEKVKTRILEYLAVRKLKADKKGPILCLIGPPGVGKTSLGRSIATALGRKFHRASLGGIHDEAAIRGHRRTYVGALPGRLVQGMKKVGVTNPVFMLDEVDKLGQGGFHGDPASALLEVLDPEQNNTFSDHYLEIPYDLSNVMFVATANQGDTIPAPLRDRMEIIEIAGYTRQEKLAIARRHLVPKQLQEHGLTTEQLEVTDEALLALIDLYTREAGVRSLDKQVASVVRGVAVRFAEASDSVVERVVVRTEDDLHRLLGAAKYKDDILERTSDPGVATGLAWTPVGGATLFIEATRMPGGGKLTLTGQLGDVMKESAMAALSYVRANTHRWGIARDFLDKSDIHIHVPAGAMPKDGPSAGVTMLTALVSLLTGIPVRSDVAMTGEITLRGRVLPIGGLKEKSLAAHRLGIKRIIAPERNRQNIDDIPADVKRDVEFVFVSHMSEVIDAALVDRPTPRPLSVLETGVVRVVAHH